MSEHTEVDPVKDPKPVPRVADFGGFSELPKKVSVRKGTEILESLQKEIEDGKSKD